MILGGVRADDEPVFGLTSAIIRPSLHRDDLRLSNSAVTDCGDLVLTEDRVCMQVLDKNPDRIAFVDVVTGEAIHLDRFTAAVKRWSIVQIVDGEPTTLFEFGPKPPSGAEGPSRS